MSEPVSPTDTPESKYKPVFSDRARTVIYVLGLAATAVGLGFMQFGAPDIGNYIVTVGGLLTGGFGVAYNPVRMAAK
ncbi:MAG: hypothetical protein ACTILK_00660 [Bifidobacterium crudilactis]|uniref:hypothetical protein n=1 Tax=Bifidobacterium crudilactis TaxID=327277 RepID=UPI003F9D1048